MAAAASSFEGCSFKARCRERIIASWKDLTKVAQNFSGGKQAKDAPSRKGRLINVRIRRAKEG
jgi:hypothetical protein